jgi:hypothetical protein
MSHELKKNSNRRCGAAMEVPLPHMVGGLMQASTARLGLGFWIVRVR